VTQLTNTSCHEGVGNNGREWLSKNDPEMCKFLDGLYGKPATK